MRQTRPFPHKTQPAPPPPPPVTRREKLRQRLKRFYSRFQTLFLIVAIAFIALGVTVGYDMTKKPPQRLTQTDLNAAFARAMASATPAPYFASEVYRAIDGDGACDDANDRRQD